MTSFLKLRTLSIVVPILCAGCGTDGVTGSVFDVLSGRTRDADTHAPLPGVSVYTIVDGTSDLGSPYDTTDAQGTFQLIWISAPESIAFQREGYHSERIAVYGTELTAPHRFRTEVFLRKLD